MSLLEVGELIGFAIRIEENGETFYRHWAKQMEKGDQRDLFEHLADEEVEHKRTFQAFKKKVEHYEPTSVEGYEEYFGYLQAFADGVLFNEKKLAEEQGRVKDFASAIDFAVRRELDSILFYSDLLRFVPKEQEAQVEAIVREERRHYMKLVQTKKEYCL